MERTTLSDYLRALRKWWWEIIIGPISTGVGLYQQIARQAISLPIWVWVLIGVSTLIVAQVLVYRSLWLKMRINAQSNWIAKYEREHGKLPVLPEYLAELFGNYSSGPISKGMIPITPSGQKWNSLLPSQQKEWRQVVEWLGKDPEDRLAHMRQMLPEDPPGAGRERWKPPEQH